MLMHRILTLIETNSTIIMTLKCVGDRYMLFLITLDFKVVVVVIIIIIII